MFKYAAKNAFRRKNIAILSILGVAIGVALMTTMASLSATITYQTNQFAASNMDLITIQQEGQFYYTSKFNFSDIYNITTVDHIAAYSAEVITQVKLSSSPFNPQLVGINIENDTAIGGDTTRIKEGRLFQNENECIVADMAAKFMDIKLNDVLPFLTPDYKWVNLTVVGFYEASNFLSGINVYTNTSTVRLFKPDFTNDTYSIMLIKADKPENVEYIKDHINKIIEEENLQLEIVLYEEQLKTINEFTGTMNVLVLSIFLIAGVAGGMSVVVSMLMSVIERMKEFATLKATGWQNRDVVKDIIYESLIITLIGGIVGFALGVFFLGFVQSFFTVELNPLQLPVVLQIIAFVVVLGIIGGLYPGYKASKASPVEILRGE